MPKVIIFCPYPPGIAPSQRFRIEMYTEDSQLNDIQFVLKSFWSEKGYRRLYSQGSILAKTASLLMGFVRRVSHVFQAWQCDYVLIHREASPIGPPIFEWFLKFILKKKIVFDFDDAIWLANTSDSNKIASSFKWHSKFNSICTWAYRVSAGNSFLGEKASEYCQDVKIIPTIVDTASVHNPELFEKKEHPFTIGWTGSHSTLTHLKIIIPLLRRLSSRFDFRLLVISNQKPDFVFDRMEFRPWTLETETSALMEMDIGIMPLPVDDWSRGKCGFKIIQYLSMRVPSIATDLAPNDLIIEEGKNGFLCNSESDWEKAFEILIPNYKKREEFGAAGRKHIVNAFSKNSQIDAFRNLFS